MIVSRQYEYTEIKFNNLHSDTVCLSAQFMKGIPQYDDHNYIKNKINQNEKN